MAGEAPDEANQTLTLVARVVRLDPETVDTVPAERMRSESCEGVRKLDVDDSGSGCVLPKRYRGGIFVRCSMSVKQSHSRSISERDLQSYPLVRSTVGQHASPSLGREDLRVSHTFASPTSLSALQVLARQRAEDRSRCGEICACTSRGRYGIWRVAPASGASLSSVMIKLLGSECMKYQQA